MGTLGAGWLGAGVLGAGIGDVGAHTRHTRSGLVRLAHARVDNVLRVSDGGTTYFILFFESIYVRLGAKYTM